MRRVKGLLFGQGIRGINVKSATACQRDHSGDREAGAYTGEIATLERERDQAPTPCKATEKKRLQLMCLTGIGPAIAAVMTREVYYRQFDNRRQVAAFLGLATSPHDSGDVERSQGISRAGRGQVRGTMIQAAWLWLKHQPKSAITRWFVQRTAGQSGRIRRIMIVAVARKLAIALWRFLEQGLVPQGAMLANR